MDYGRSQTTRGYHRVMGGRPGRMVQRYTVMAAAASKRR